MKFPALPSNEKNCLHISISNFCLTKRCGIFLATSIDRSSMLESEFHDHRLEPVSIVFDNSHQWHTMEAEFKKMRVLRLASGLSLFLVFIRRNSGCSASVLVSEYEVCVGSSCRVVIRPNGCRVIAGGHLIRKLRCWWGSQRRIVVSRDVQS